MKYWDSDLISVNRDRELVIRDTSTLTEQVYLSRDKQIAQFLRSGMMLKASRLGYEYPDGNVPDDVKTTVFDRPDVDLVDVFDAQNRIKDSLSRASEAAKKQQKNDAADELQQDATGLQSE